MKDSEHVQNPSIQKLISAGRLLRRTKELGRAITEDYGQQKVLAVCVLRGAVIFFSDLVRELDLDLSLDFISVASYGSATESTGEVRLVKDLESSIRDRHVLLVEDIVDTGLTLHYLLKILLNRHPASLKVCALLSKPSRRRMRVSVNYIGFEIPDLFVVGYGLDHDQKYRNLPYIGAISEIH